MPFGTFFVLVLSEDKIMCVWHIFMVIPPHESFKCGQTQMFHPKSLNYYTFRKPLMQLLKFRLPMIYCLIKRITCCVLTHFHRNNFILGRKKGVPKILDEKKKIKNIVNEN